MTIVPRNGVPGKVCVVCVAWKPLSEFKGNGKSADGYDHKCRGCRGYRQIKHSFRDGIEGKQCTGCKDWKPLTEFHVNNNLSDGLNSICKACSNAKSKHYYDLDPAAWNQRNIASYYRNHESRLAYAHKWRQVNLDAIRAYDRARSRERYQREPQRRVQYTHARRARLRKAKGSFTADEWRALCERYEHTCLCCGKREPEIKLTPDHVIPISRGGTNDIDNIQPLCLTCNLSKATKETDYR